MRTATAAKQATASLRLNNQRPVHAFAAGFVVVWSAVEHVCSGRVCRKQCKAIAVAWHRDVQVQFIHIEAMPGTTGVFQAQGGKLTSLYADLAAFECLE